MRKKVSSTVYLRLDQVSALRALSRSTGVPTAEYIRRGVDAVLTGAKNAGFMDAPEVAESSTSSAQSELEQVVEKVMRRLLTEQKS